MAETKCPCCGSTVLMTKPLVDLNTNTASANGQTVKLTPREAEIMHVLTKAYPTVVRHEQIVYRVWGPEAELENPNNTLKALICTLRRKISKLGYKIVNLPWEGYYLREVGL